MPSLVGIHAKSKVVLWRQGAMPWAPRWTRVHDRFMPLRPIWPGFAVNTIVYAALLWLPIVVRSAQRVHIQWDNQMHVASVASRYPDA